MDSKEFQDYLENRYKKQMEYYSKTSVKLQGRYEQFQWILIILSALTPVLAALITKWPQLQISVVIVSAIVAILTTGLKTFQFQELWVSYRSTYEQLKPEIHYYHFGVGPYESTVNKDSLFVSRIESILDKEHKQWPVSKKLEEEKNKGESTESTTTESQSNAEPSS